MLLFHQNSTSCQYGVHLITSNWHLRLAVGVIRCQCQHVMRYVYKIPSDTLTSECCKKHHQEENSYQRSNNWLLSWWSHCRRICLGTAISAVYHHGGTLTAAKWIHTICIEPAKHQILIEGLRERTEHLDIFLFSAHHSMVFYFRCSVYWWKGSVRY